MRRSVLYKTAVILHTIIAIVGTIASFPALLNGPSNQGVGQGVPQVVLILVALLGVAGLISAYGAWQGQKWGIWLTIVIRASDGLAALPGILFAPTLFAQLAAVISILVAIFVIFVLLRRR